MFTITNIKFCNIFFIEKSINEATQREGGGRNKNPPSFEQKLKYCYIF